MELKAFTRTIYDMLAVRKKYIVPSYKRGYTWTINELTEFWKDIVSNISLSDNILITKERFIGSIVLVDDENQNNVLIIDGHQRLITVTVLFAALVEAFKESGRIDLATSLQSLISDKQKKVFKIQNEIPRNYLQKAIQSYEKVPMFPDSYEDKNIKFTYEFFSSKFASLSPYDFLEESDAKDCNIKKVAFLEAIRDHVLKLVMICITVGNENDAYTILGTLNAKVQNLTPVDFIKNEVVKKLNPQGLSLEAEGKWRKIRQLLNSREDRNTIETFFMHYWPSKYEYTPSEKLYKSFKSKVAQNPENMYRFLDDLLIAAKDYAIISDPLPSDFKQQEEREIYSSLAALELFRASSAKILLLALFEIRRKNLITLNDFISTITKVENYHFIATTICLINAPSLERLYSTNAIAFRRSTSIYDSKEILSSLTKELEALLPDYGTFKEGLSKIFFLDGKPRYKKLIQYIFKKWEAYLIATNELEMAEITLEHILSQSSDNPHVGMLGNLLPLAGQLNHTAGNKDFISKLELYKKSQFKTVRQFVIKYQQKDKWDERDIIIRTNEIAKLLYYEIFKIN